MIDSNPGILFFCDSTQFIAPTDPRVWKALLQDYRVAITPPIFDELQYWLANPKENQIAHEQVKASMNGDHAAPISWVRFDNPEHVVVCEYYANLLGMRKDMFAMAREKLERELGRKVTRQEVSNHCQAVGTSRAQLLGRQGEDAKVPSHKINDEFFVMTAMLFAIVTGREIAIISSDEAVLDQFYKAVWLLDTHYRSMLLADKYFNDQFAFRTRRLPNPYSQAFNTDQLLMIERPSSTLHEVLPKTHSPVLMHCFLIQEQMTQLSFRAEIEMRGLLAVKARTEGLSTDHFDGRNCHVFLGDRVGERLGNWAVIARDRTTLTPNGMKLALVDIELALLANEHTVNLRVVDPTLLHLPASYEF